MSTGFSGGARTAAPIVISFIPFGMLFGALAVDNGLSVFEAILMSATLFAGASQLVGLELFGQNVAPWLVIFSVFAVNFRHILYSAAIGRRIRRYSWWQKAVAFFLLTDPQFAESEKRAEAGLPLTFSWYLGLGLTNYACWVGLTSLGAVFGSMIPNTGALGLDFLLPIYFLGLLMGFRRRPMWLPVVVVSGIASIVALRFVGSPWHVSLGALAGIVLAVVLSAGRRDADRPEGAAG